MHVRTSSFEYQTKEKWDKETKPTCIILFRKAVERVYIDKVTQLQNWALIQLFLSFIDEQSSLWPGFGENIIHV